MACADEIKESAVVTPIVDPSSKIPSGDPLANPHADSLPEPSADAEKENEITVSLYRHHEVCPWPLCADAVICVGFLARCLMSVWETNHSSGALPFEIIATICESHLLPALCTCPCQQH